MDTLPPAWFDNSCTAPFPHGTQLVAIEREAAGEQITGRIQVDDAGQVWLSATDYLAWTGLSALPSTSKVIGTDRWYPLTAIPYQLDACSMRLQVAAELPRRHYRDIRAPDPAQMPAERGGYLNMDIFGFSSEHMGASVAGQTELGLSSAGGLWRTREVFLREGYRRLDSQVRWDFPSQMMALEAGDIINTGLSMSPNVRFGGLSWGTDFSQRPELPTYPLPSIQGNAALPSTAELYVDGQLRQSNRLSAGPYALDSQSGINGAGDLQVVVRDSLGRETRISQPFYSSPQLLRAGLSDYHLDIGYLREGFGTDNDHYRQGFASGRWRQGTQRLGTIGLRADILADSQSTQGEWSYSTPRWGLWQLGLGGSHSRSDGWGERISAGYEWLSRRGSIQAQASASSPAFIELGREAGAIASSMRIQTGWRVGPASSFTLGWSDEHRRDRDNLSIATASWQQTLSANRQAYVSLIQSPGLGLNSSIGLTQGLISNWSLSSQLSHRASDGYGVQLSLQWQPSESPWSARLAGEVRAHEQLTQANWLYTGTRGQANVGIGERNGLSSVQGSVATSLAWVPDNLFWSKRLQNGFVIVDAGAPDITVYRNHQAVGRTDQHGQLLVSDTWPYQGTEFSLGWEDIPLNAQLGSLEATLRPPRGIGHVRLASANAVTSQSWQARLDTGEWLPAGSILRNKDQTAELPSGLDGLLYLPSDWQGNSLEAILPDQRHCLITSLPAIQAETELTCRLQI